MERPNTSRKDITIVITVFRSTWMTSKINGVAIDFFLYGCDRSFGMHVLKLGTEIPNLKQRNWSTKMIWNSKSRSKITCEKGLAPSRRPFGNGTN